MKHCLRKVDGRHCLMSDFQMSRKTQDCKYILFIKIVGMKTVHDKSINPKISVVSIKGPI